MTSGRSGLIALVVWWTSSAALGQDLIIRGDVQVIGGRRIAVINDLTPTRSQSGDTSGEATLKVDPELESILQKAERYQADGNYTVACQLWQIVLERSGDTLYTNDGQSYFSMVEQVERILASLPEEGLRAYRITADAQARQWLAQAESPDDRRVLGEVVRKYFISSVGDDAAFRLACLDLDQMDFVGALRLLTKILHLHPDPTPSAEELLPRIALCQVMVGNLREARATIEQLPARARTARQAGGLADQMVTAAEAGRDTGFGRMQTHSFVEFRLSPDIPAHLRTGHLYAQWQSYMEPTKDGSTTYQPADAVGRVLEVQPDSLSAVANSVTSGERNLIDAWNANGWRPAGIALIDNGLVFHRAPANVTVWSANGGTAPVWRSVWISQFELDDATRHLQNLQRAYGGRVGPTIGRAGREGMESDASMQLFGDVIQQAMTIAHGRLYVLEGKRVTGKSSEKRGAQNQVGFNFNAAPRRGRKNFLTAYELTTGRVLWTLPSDTTPVVTDGGPEAQRESPFLSGGGFMGPPVAFGTWLLVPVTHSGAIHVYAIDPNQEGRTIWQTFLCDEPETGADVWSPIQLTLSGSDLFVATGLGVVFILDPTTGMVRFAQRYARQGTANTALRNINYNAPARLDFDGWSEDIVIPYGREMICFVSDSNRIFSLDRTTGRIIWETDIKPLGHKIDYILGIHNHVLYAAGRKTMIAIDLLGEGRMLWGGEECFGGGRSLGRGLLTRSGLYIPVQDSIWHFSLEGKNSRAHVLGTTTVDMGTGAPVGNLSTDGRHLWATGGYRLYRLEQMTP